MKIKLNIKEKKKLYQRANLPIIAAFVLLLIIAVVWIRSTHSVYIQYTKKIAERQSQNASLKQKKTGKAAEKRVTESKQYIDSAVLERVNKKIQFLEKFTSVNKSAFLFFDGLEKSLTGEIFINNISAKDKNNEFRIEGISSNADNISEFVKKLQACPVFSKAELVGITGGNAETRCMNFNVSLVYDREPKIEFTPGGALSDASAARKAR